MTTSLPKPNIARTPCEVYSRVNGYLRPVKQWNDAKQAEFAMRKYYDIKKEDYL